MKIDLIYSSQGWCLISAQGFSTSDAHPTPSPWPGNELQVGVLRVTVQGQVLSLPELFVLGWIIYFTKRGGIPVR